MSDAFNTFRMITATLFQCLILVALIMRFGWEIAKDVKGNPSVKLTTILSGNLWCLFTFLTILYLAGTFSRLIPSL
jgi:hypothetical protein